MQRVNTNKMSLLIDQFIKEQGLEEGLMRVRILKAWDSVVGERAAAYTVSKYFNKGILYCTVSSSMLRTQLGFRKEDIISGMNKLLDKEIINDIVLR